MRTTALITLGRHDWQRGSPIIEMSHCAAIKDVWVNTNGTMSVLIEKNVDTPIWDGPIKRTTLCLIEVGQVIPGFLAYLCRVPSPDGGPTLLAYVRAAE